MVISNPHPDSLYNHIINNDSVIEISSSNRYLPLSTDTFIPSNASNKFRLSVFLLTIPAGHEGSSFWSDSNTSTLPHLTISIQPILNHVKQTEIHAAITLSFQIRQWDNEWCFYWLIESINTDNLQQRITFVKYSISWIFHISANSRKCYNRPILVRTWHVLSINHRN